MRDHGKLQELYDKRGNPRAYLHLTYSPKSARDIALGGKLAYYHFLLVESDPQVQKAWYRERLSELVELLPRNISAAALVGEVLELHILRTTSSGILKESEVCELHQFYEHLMSWLIKREGLASRSTDIKVLTENDIVLGNETRLRNWNRLLVWLAQARFHDLTPYHGTVRTQLRRLSTLTVHDVLRLDAQPQTASLLLAAAIEGVARGQWYADFDVVQFGRNSRFSWAPHPLERGGRG